MNTSKKGLIRTAQLAAIGCAALLLAACGSDAPEGKYKVTKKAMGMDFGTSTAVITSDTITMDGSKFKVDEWVKEDGKIFARDKEGKLLFQADIKGDDLESVEGGGAVVMFFKRQ